MEQLLDQTYYGNTVLEWLTAAVIIVASIALGKVLYWLFSNVVRKLTAKSDTKLDDILIDMIEEPVVVALILFGIWTGINTLTLPESMITFTGNVIQFLIVMMIGWMIARLLDALYVQLLIPLADKSENDLDDQLLPILRKGTRMVVWTMAGIIGLNNAGYDVGALIAGLGIGGLALAMAAKDTVSNVFGGLTIFTDKPFTINDRVKVAGFDGTIKEIGVRSTRLETLEGRTVTIPNAKFADTPVENVSWEPSRKVTVDLGLTYDTTPEKMEQAMAILNEIAAGNPSLEEKRTVFFSGFGDFAMNIKFIYYIRKGEDIAGTQNAVNLEILKHYNAERLEFAFPTQTLYNINATGAAA